MTEDRTPASGEATSRAAFRRWIIATALLALLVRGGLALLTLPQSTDDPDAYVAIAETLAEYGVYGLANDDGRPRPIAFRPPLYPAILSLLVFDGELSRLATALLHTLLGVATALAIFVITRHVLADCRTLREDARLAAAGVAATLVVFDPVLAQQSTEIMTETLAAALAVLVWASWLTCVRHDFPLGRSLVLGGSLSLAYLCRPTFLVWAAALIAIAAIGEVWQRRTNDSTARLSLRQQCKPIAGLLAVLLVVLLTVATWMARNQHAIGQPVWATTHGGYTLLLGNNPLFYDYLRSDQWGRPWDSERFQRAYWYRYDGDPSTDAFWRRDWRGPHAIEMGKVSGVSERDDDQRAYQAARATIRREPGMFLWSSLVRIGRLWSPWPHATAERSWVVIAGVGIYYLVFYAAMVCGLWQLGIRFLSLQWWPVLALALTLTAVHAVYWSNLRMRAPVIPMLAVVAAVPVAFRIQKVTNKG